MMRLIVSVVILLASASQIAAAEPDPCQQGLTKKCGAWLDKKVGADRAICLSKERIRIGMSIAEVETSRWSGPPPRAHETNVTETAGHVREQWIYEGELDEEQCSRTTSDGHRYLYFDNGILTAIQR
jgi:hypothetical protein